MQKNQKAKLGAYLATPIMSTLTMLLASLVSMYVFKFTGEKSPVPVFIFFGVVNLVCMLLFAALPVKQKGIARHSAMFIVGSTLVFLAGLLGKQNFQIEGFFFFAFAGAFGGVIIHFVVGKIIGPLLQGRNWCSWGCWTVMILDLLPFKQSQGWMKGKSIFRFIYFTLALGVVFGLVYGLKYTMHTGIPVDALRALYWFGIGNALYYVLAIALAIALKDNRAFCKYVCPVSVFLKAGTVFSLLRIKGKQAQCTNCGDCAKACPMNINIPDFVSQGQRVKSTECIMCMKCITVCSTASLRSSIGLDMATKDQVKMY